MWILRIRLQRFFTLSGLILDTEVHEELTSNKDDIEQILSFFREVYRGTGWEIYDVEILNQNQEFIYNYVF